MLFISFIENAVCNQNTFYSEAMLTQTLLLNTYYMYHGIDIHVLKPSITSTEHEGPNPDTTALIWL